MPFQNGRDFLNAHRIPRSAIMTIESLVYDPAHYTPKGTFEAYGIPLDEITLSVVKSKLGKNVVAQLPVPHDSTVALFRKLGGVEGKEGL